MARNNPYYQRCKFLKTTFHDRGISSFCTHACTLFGQVINESAYIKTMCCISNSPYMKQNCRYFQDVSGTKQTTLEG